MQYQLQTLTDSSSQRVFLYNPMIYRIKNWNEFYENNRSRTVKDLTWVPIPNRHDGEAYARLMSQKDATIHFTVWILLLQVASRCQPRGSLLTSSCQPHTPESLALKTRSKVEWFEKSLPFLVQIGWLEVERQETDSVLSASCQACDEEGKEGNGKKGMEGKEAVMELVDLWNSTTLPKCVDVNLKRVIAAKTRLSEKFFGDNWKIAIEKLRVSRFCNGGNDRGWRADIDWFLKPDSISKIIEGKYDNKNNESKTKLRPSYTPPIK